MWYMYFVIYVVLYITWLVGSRSYFRRQEMKIDWILWTQQSDYRSISDDGNKTGHQNILLFSLRHKYIIS
jgi:hypothetical protein